MKVPLNDVDIGRWVSALGVWEKTGLCKETGLCDGCVEGNICLVGLSKEIGLHSGCVEGDRSVQWVCWR